MKWFIYLVLIIAVIVIQQSIFNVLNLGFYTPDLLLLLTLSIVWANNNFDFVLFAVLGGFWTEVTFGLPVGSLVLSLLLIGSAAYLIINRWLFSEKSWQYFFGAVIISTVFFHAWLWIYTSTLFAFGWSDIAITGKMFLRGMLPVLLVNIILTSPIFVGTEVLVGYIQKWSRPGVMKL